MRIAQIAPPWISVPPSGYGGTEWVVKQLCDGLTARGHQVVLYASGDSRTAAELRFVFPQQIPQHMWRSSYEARHAGFALADILSRRAGQSFDLVHDHSGFMVASVAGRLPLPPTLHTIHCSFNEETRDFYAQFGDSLTFNGISAYQRSMGPPGMRWAGVVHNAILLEDWPYHAEKDDYLLAFGRVCEDKGFHLAIEVARRTGRKLVMAGVLQPQCVEYFEREIEPQLDDQVQYLGEVDGDLRRQLFSRAAGFLFPILWPEPFGLVMIEAMATGTPVIALRHGSVDEVLEDGVTGFIVNDVDEMTARVAQLDEIDGQACRRRVEALFTVDRLLDEYEAIYNTLLKERSAVRS